jgi:uncharacterized membrane protein
MSSRVLPPTSAKTRPDEAAAPESRPLAPKEALISLGPEATWEHAAYGHPTPGPRTESAEPAGQGETSVPDKPAEKKRIIAIDAARGFAFIGMVAVHTLPALTPDRQNASVAWTLFAGHASALFALVAGISLSFSTGGPKGLKPERRASARAALAVRALLILLIGLTLNLAPLQQVSILAFYGVMFFLAVPFLSARIPVLVGAAVVALVGVPFLMQAVAPYAPTVSENPQFADLVNDPGGFLVHILLTGTYPAGSWIGFVFVGLAIGRSNLRAKGAGLWLFVGGAVLAAAAYYTSEAWLLRLGGYEAIAAATPGMSEDAIDTIIVFGPDARRPASTFAWLILAGPHTDTPFALTFSLGVASAFLGFFLIIGRWSSLILRPLAYMGSMTLTLYASHLLLMTVIPWYEVPWLCFWLQIAAALLVAAAWMRAVGRGPLEALVTFVSKAAGRFAGSLADRHRERRAAAESR